MLTVLMATYNGAQTLPRVLEGFLALKPPSNGWRLVVIDNASTDDTPKIIKQYSDKLPMVGLHTDRRGKNTALNEGLKHVQGDLVVFTDDDAIPDPGWLEALRIAADKHADFDVFGGHILPVWPGDPPEWILRLVNLGATFAITPIEIPVGPVVATQIWGANMAVRGKVFAAGLQFNEGFGPQRGQYKMGSEVEFSCRIEKRGHKAWFVPDAKVGHIIRPWQLEREWVIQRAYRLGRHMYHQEAPSFANKAALVLGAPRWKYRLLLSAYGVSMAGILQCNSDKKFKGDWEKSFYKGYLAEARKNR